MVDDLGDKGISLISKIQKWTEFITTKEIFFENFTE
jgi:hypothetical protein